MGINQQMFQVPVIGGRGYIIPYMAIYTTYIITAYILPIRGLYATYHLLREPETNIEGISRRKSSFEFDVPPRSRQSANLRADDFCGATLDDVEVFTLADSTSWVQLGNVY